MPKDKEAFKKLIAEANDEWEIDIASIGWLMKLSRDHGRDGEIAAALLDQVRKLLDI
jgi:hypothetical protein